MDQRQRFGGGALEQTGPALKFQEIQIPKVDDVLAEIAQAKGGGEEVIPCLNCGNPNCPGSRRVKR